MEPQFRRLAAGDAPVLRNVAKDVFDYKIEALRAERFLADGQNILIVALDGECVVGQIAAVIHRHIDARSDLYIDNLGVTPARNSVSRACVPVFLATRHRLAPATDVGSANACHHTPMLRMD